MLPFFINVRILLLAFFAIPFGLVALGHDGHVGGDQEHVGNRFMTTRAKARDVPAAKQDGVFQFLIYGDRTGGVPEGLKVLEQAVADTNLLDPDLVMTVGDLIEGYNETPQWLEQMNRYKAIMGGLKMPWYPVAGNHDVYWRGENPPPEGQHEANYEKHFGPLWYSFSHKNAGFIVLYSDEGDPETNRKGFHEGRLQRMSEAQLDFLKTSLAKLSDLDHVFVFLHHPRWIMPRYQGGNWESVHTLLKNAGNVSAVFAGHIHRMRCDGQRDGIEYHTLATTGGSLRAEIPDAGFLHHMNVVTVREDRFTVAAIPVGAVFDPKQFTPDFLSEVDLAQGIRPTTPSSGLSLRFDGSATGKLAYSITNPAKFPVEVTLRLEADSQWNSSVDHQHFRLASKATHDLVIELERESGSIESLTIPRVVIRLELLTDSARVRLPETGFEVPVVLSQVPTDHFVGSKNQFLRVEGTTGVARIEHRDLELPLGPMTAEAWLRPRQLNDFTAAIAKTENSEFAIFVDEGVPQFDINLSGKYYSAKAKTKLVQNHWTHVAGTYDESSVRLFLDGQLVAEVPVTGRRRRNWLPFYVGADPAYNGSPTRPFIGDIDEVRLSSEAIYREPFTPPRRLKPLESTVLMLHFDRKFGPFVLDHSSRAAKTTLGNEAVITGEGSH